MGRRARFLTIGVLIFVFGDEIQSFIDDNFEKLALASAAGLVALVATVLIVGRVRRVRRGAG